MDLALDGYCGHPPMLDDAQLMREFICRLADRIGMTIVNGPTVVSFKEHSGDPTAGLSAFAIIAESHIALHTWPPQGFIMVDVISCRDFDSLDAINFIKEALRLTPTYNRISERGVPVGIHIRGVP